MIIKEEIGEFCADGEIGLNFLTQKLMPKLNENDQVILDFSGVRNMNSSFANALFGNLIILNGKAVLLKMEFKNLRENVRKEIIGGLNYGEKYILNKP